MAPTCCIYFFPLLFFCFPLDGYHGVEPAAALAYRALLLIAFLPLVLLPVVSVALTVWATMPSAFEALSHSSSWTHQPRGYFDGSFFLAHIQSTILFSNIVICFIFLPIALAKKNSAKAPGLSCQSGSRQMISHRFSCIMSRRSISS